MSNTSFQGGNNSVPEIYFNDNNFGCCVTLLPKVVKAISLFGNCWRILVTAAFNSIKRPGTNK